ncbi:MULTISPECIES: hypothetical protein [unclassified Wolbachia]|nr:MULTISPECIES: hypothetical protein [unclassified Wolbachia]
MVRYHIVNDVMKVADTGSFMTAVLDTGMALLHRTLCGSNLR